MGPNWQETYHLHIPLIVIANWAHYMLPIHHLLSGNHVTTPLIVAFMETGNPPLEGEISGDLFCFESKFSSIFFLGGGKYLDPGIILVYFLQWTCWIFLAQTGILVGFAGLPPFLASNQVFISGFVAPWDVWMNEWMKIVNAQDWQNDVTKDVTRLKIKNPQERSCFPTW